MPESSSSIKAIGDWTLDILAAPFGSPARKDAHGEYFDLQTDFAEQHYPLAPIVYYHGFEASGRPARKPVFIGRAIARETRVDGVWYRAELDPAKPEAQLVMKAAREGRAAASPGTADHLRRVAPDGHCEFWPILELSSFDTYSGQRPANSYAVALPAVKALYAEAGIALPPEAEETSSMAGTDTQANVAQPDIHTLVSNAVKAALAEQSAAHLAEQQAAAERQAEIDKAVKAATDALAADWAAKMRLPDGSLGTPIVAQFAALRPFDHIDAADTATLITVLEAAHETRAAKKAPSEAAYKALVIKLDEDQTRVGDVGRKALKAENIKANEIMQSQLTGSGHDWVSVAYSQSIWDRIRLESFVAANLPSIEIPQGSDSITIPLEGADPTFYKVGEATGIDATGAPATTIGASKASTDSRTLTAVKMGARVIWSGEMEEDSLIPFVSQLRSQLATAGMEQFEHAIIDGDTATAATTNINDITNASTQPTGLTQPLFLLFDGFRKLALVTNTSNSRAGAALALSDFINTVKLMGVSGINALGQNRSKVGFLVDPLTYYAAMQLTQVQTRDLFSSPTIEGGELTGLYGYKLRPSGQICRMSGNGLSNAAGKVDQVTPANNTKGSILAVRWDQWRLGYKRRMTTEVTRIPRADASEIVCLMRVALKPRDNEAVGLTYNLTV